MARSTIAGYPHQVTQRGNYEQRVFDDDTDFKRYLSWAQEYTRRYGIDIWAYCLMPNHVHFVCVPTTDRALALGFNALHMRYAQYFHQKKGVTGHLWRARFLSCLLDEASAFEEIRFIENNPVRAGFVGRAEEYGWSSARHHIFQEPNLLVKACRLRAPTGEPWRDYLDEDGNGEIVGRIRRSLKTGRPAGSPEFIRLAESILGRRLGALPRGRPRKHGPLAS